MSTTANAEPLTTAELDALDALDRARTPGLLRASGVTVSVDAGACAMGRIVAMCGTTAESHAIAAALNALPALLAEVRRWRAQAPAPSPDAWAEPDGDDGADVASDDGPRLHIPRDLLTRPEGR